MAQPKRKSSHARSAKRATHKKARPIGLSKCPNCGELKLPHVVCYACGYYGDREIIKVKE